MKQYDFLVIGSGPAGQKAAIQAAKFGKRAAVLVLGGTLQYFLETVFNYPTLAEAYKIAMIDLRNRISG